MSLPPPTQKQARVLWFCVTALAVAVLLMLIGMLLWALGWVFNRLSAVLLPIAIAVIFAYLLDPVVEFFVRKKIPRLRAIILVFFICTMLVLGLLGTVLPGLIAEAQRLVNDLPEDARKLGQKIEQFMDKSPLGINLKSIWQTRPVETPSADTNQVPPATDDTNAPSGTNEVELNLSFRVTGKPQDKSAPVTNAVDFKTSTERIKQALDLPFSETVMPGLAKVAVFVVKWITSQLSRMAWWVGFLAGLVLVPVYLFYFLLEKKGITASWTDYLPLQESKAKEELVFILRAINDCLIVFFRGQVLVAMCVGVLMTIGYMLLGLKYALVLGLLAGILGIIPYLGVMASLIPAIIIAIIQFGTWWHPLLVVVICILVQTTEGLFLSPKIIGDRVGMHPLTVIIAVMIGTTLMGGIIGGVLAIPITAVLRTLMFRYVWRKRAGKPKKE